MKFNQKFEIVCVFTYCCKSQYRIIAYCWACVGHVCVFHNSNDYYQRYRHFFIISIKRVFRNTLNFYFMCALHQVFGLLWIASYMQFEAVVKLSYCLNFFVGKFRSTCRRKRFPRERKFWKAAENGRFNCK